MARTISRVNTKCPFWGRDYESPVSRPVALWQIAAGAPAPPHCTIGGFHMAGEARRIHERRRSHPVPQSRSQFRQPREVIGQFAGNVHEFCVVRCDQFGQADGAQQSQTRTTRRRISDQAHDGHPHPHGIASGGDAVIRERIEAEIDFVVQFQIIDPGAGLHKVHAVSRHAGGRKIDRTNSCHDPSAPSSSNRLCGVAASTSAQIRNVAALFFIGVFSEANVT